MTVVKRLAYEARASLLALSGCFNALGYILHGGWDLTAARAFEERGRHLLLSVADDWHSALVRSRFHRALALVGLRDGSYDEAASELRRAVAHGADLLHEGPCPELALIAAENECYLLEAELNLRMRTQDRSSPAYVRRLCSKLIACDPNSVEARLTAGNGYVSIGDYRDAARWYAHAGELETVSGAQGWYRAAQCYEWLGDREQADFAMAKCLELDTTAIEPRHHLLSRSTTRHRK
jgi:predicted Zn-dependent protease